MHALFATTSGVPAQLAWKPSCIGNEAGLGFRVYGFIRVKVSKEGRILDPHGHWVPFLSAKPSAGTCSRESRRVPASLPHFNSATLVAAPPARPIKQAMLARSQNSFLHPDALITETRKTVIRQNPHEHRPPDGLVKNPPKKKKSFLQGKYRGFLISTW